MRFIKILGVFFIILFVLSACNLKDYASVKIALDTGITVGNARHVYIRVFDSDFNLLGRNYNDSNGYAIISAGSSGKVINIVNFDSNYYPINTDAEFKEGNYIVHIAINDNGDLSGSKANFEIGEKVCLKSFNIKTLNDITVNIGPSDLFNSVSPDTVNLTSTDSISGPKDAYCIWLPSGIYPLSGYFQPYQQLSVSSGTLNGTTGTVNSKYGTWFGLVPNIQYSIYCFVDVNADGFISYNLDYEGGVTETGGNGSTHTINVQKVIH